MTQWGVSAEEVLKNIEKLSKQPPKKTVVLLSGGMDSATVLQVAKKISSDVTALVVNYGQLHEREIQAAKGLAFEADVEIKEVDLTSITSMLRTALKKDSDLVIPEVANKKEVPATYVPFRNTMFLAIAASIAESKGYDTIMYAANAIDYSGYPDCRPEYVQAMNNVLYTHADITIETPIIDLSKAEIVKLGTALEVPFELTWSCYRGGGKACGKCPSCEYRLKGFSEAKLTDPIAYEGAVNTEGYVDV